jgi:hypothetical protein
MIPSVRRGALIQHPLFAGIAGLAHYQDTTLYADLTVLVTAKAILQKARGDYKATIIVDGLHRSEVKRFAHGNCLGSALLFG